ncbi:MAG: DUF58 domain-containing protein [Bacteroidales bacterium]|nr:DUF58 domain-containing protein [Bacteroidales bacterium]
MKVESGKWKDNAAQTASATSPLSTFHFPLAKSLDFFARQVVEGFITGRHKSPFHGFSAEFSDYRQYNSGESTRHIDWHLYGRTDRLYVKQFEEETNLRCQLLVDHSTSMLFPLERHGDADHPNKLTFAVYASAVLIELLHRQRDAFGLTLLGDGIDLNTPCRSNAVHQRWLLGKLDSLLQPVDAEHRPLRGTALAEDIHLVAEQLHRRSLVVLFTDAFVHPGEQEPLFDALRHLRHNKHEVILFHTFDRAHELDLAYDARPHQFIDLETGRRLRLQPDEVAAAYSREMHALQADLQQHALQYHIDYVPVDVSLGFNQVLLPFLLKRSRL